MVVVKLRGRCKPGGKEEPIRIWAMGIWKKLKSKSPELWFEHWDLKEWGWCQREGWGMAQGERRGIHFEIQNLRGWLSVWVGTYTKPNSFLSGNTELEIWVLSQRRYLTGCEGMEALRKAIGRAEVQGTHTLGGVNWGQKSLNSIQTFSSTVYI